MQHPRCEAARRRQHNDARKHDDIHAPPRAFFYTRAALLPRYAFFSLNFTSFNLFCFSTVFNPFPD
jgi:hypothetical protein